MTLYLEKPSTDDLEAPLLAVDNHERCLCRFEDGSVFAYVERGHEYVRTADHELWATERGDVLVSARSGVPLAYRRGKVYFAAGTDEPLYYERAI